MSSQPLVSVIIPAYNAEKHIRETIESVIAQNYTKIEIIVVDDGSTDNTAEIIKSFPKINYIFQENQGHGMAKHVGTLHATGELLAFLDADDLWVNHKTQIQVEYLQNNPDLGFVVCQYTQFLDEGTTKPDWLRSELDAPCSAFIPSGLLVRRTVIEDIGGFDPKYKRGNDSDWFFRAKDRKIPMTVIPEVLFKRRIHNENLSHKPIEMYAELRRVIKSSINRQKSKTE